MNAYEYMGTIEALLKMSLEYADILAYPDEHEWYEVEATKKSILRVKEKMIEAENAFKQLGE